MIRESSEHDPRISPASDTTVVLRLTHFVGDPRKTHKPRSPNIAPAHLFAFHFWWHLKGKSRMKEKIMKQTVKNRRGQSIRNIEKKSYKKDKRKEFRIAKEQESWEQRIVKIAGISWTMQLRSAIPDAWHMLSGVPAVSWLMHFWKVGKFFRTSSRILSKTSARAPPVTGIWCCCQSTYGWILKQQLTSHLTVKEV